LSLPDRVRRAREKALDRPTYLMPKG